jgi:hypothetical protein
MNGCEFSTMHCCELGEQALAVSSQVHFDFPAVPRTVASLNESARLAARRKRNDAVRLRLQAFSKFADMGECSSRETLYVEQQQVLQWCDAVRSSRSLREPLESAHLVAKLRELFERGLGKRGIARSSHLFTQPI